MVCLRDIIYQGKVLLAVYRRLKCSLLDMTMSMFRRKALLFEEGIEVRT